MQSGAVPFRREEEMDRFLSAGVPDTEKAARRPVQGEELLEALSEVRAGQEET